MSKYEKWEDKTILKIKREFSDIEKYNILIKNYQEMEARVDVYKKQVTKLQGICGIYKKQYAQLQDKYVKLCKHFKVDQYGDAEKL